MPHILYLQILDAKRSPPLLHHAQRHGILLYLTETVKGGWRSDTIKAVVNPRKVLEPESGYLGIAPTDSDSLERFQDAFTLLMRKYHLPEFLEEWKLTRLDLCVNLQLNKKKSAREFCRLLQKNLLPSKLKRASFLNPNADKKEQKRQKDRDRHSVCLTNGSYEIIVYDKLFQVKTEDLDGDTAWESLPDGILRVELRCFSLYLDQLPSLPLILELLEDDTTAIKLMTDGSMDC